MGGSEGSPPSTANSRPLEQEDTYHVLSYREKFLWVIMNTLYTLH